MYEHLPSSQEIRYFVEIAKTKVLARAAERLGVTQPALTLAIKKLESTVGTTLLIRTKTGVELTTAGKRFLSEAKTLLNQWTRLKSEVEKDSSEIQGRYTIGCHPVIAICDLPQFLPKLLNDYPKLEINLVHDLSRKINEQIISLEIDLGIVVNPIKHADLVIKELMKDSVTFYHSFQCKNKDVLIYDPSLAQSQSLIKQVEFKRHIHSSDLNVVAGLANDGVGVAILPESLAKRYPELRKDKRTNAHYEDSICLVYRAHAHKEAAFTEIIEAIKKNLK